MRLKIYEKSSLWIFILCDFHIRKFLPAARRQVRVFLPLLVMLLLKSSVQDMHKRIADYVYSTLQRQNAENLKQIFPEKE
jgi:hypothetical protein